MAITGFDLEKFKANFEGGARQYLFMMRPMFPLNFGITTEKSQYLVRATNLPGITLDPIIVNWQGYDFKMAGKHTFADFTVTFNVDVKSKILLAFNRWADFIHNIETNVHALPSDYMQDQVLYLLDGEGEPTITYRLIDAWPSVIAEAPITYDANEVVMFDVTFAYQTHKVLAGRSF